MDYSMLIKDKLIITQTEIKHYYKRLFPQYGNWKNTRIDNKGLNKGLANM